jgi:hypothetical protein
MSDFNISDIEFLFEPDYWMWGPCFQIIFFFEKKCFLSVFEDALLTDSIVFSHLMLPAVSPEDKLTRSVVPQVLGWDSS